MKSESSYRKKNYPLPCLCLDTLDLDLVEGIVLVTNYD